MAAATDLLDQFAELVLGGDDPRRLADRTLGVALALTNGRSAGVFTVDRDRLTLFASRGIDQAVLDAVEAIWQKHQDSLRKGSAFYSADRQADTRLPAGLRERRGGFVAMPVFKGQELVALVYVDSEDKDFCRDDGVVRLGKIVRILAKAVGAEAGADARDESVLTYLERTPVEDIEREKLLLLLNQNEWNISRVSRLMNVTRRTIYLRLARYKVPRQRVPKGRPRLRPRPATS